MQFNVLRETADNSGQYVATGQVLDCGTAEACETAFTLAAGQTSRIALQPYEPIRPAGVPVDSFPFSGPAAPVTEPTPAATVAPASNGA